MDKELERYLIIFLLLVLIGMPSCADKTVEHDAVVNPEPETVEVTVESHSTVQNIPNIVQALTCMFAPDTCEAKKDLGNTEEGKQ